jgi:cobalamin biosynthesis Mg chelatase CobN
MATNHEIQIEAPSTNSLNGMPDPGVSTSAEYKQQQESSAHHTTKKKSTTKESTPLPTTGTAAPRVYDNTSTTSTATSSKALSARSPKEHFDLATDFWVPFTIVVALFVTLFKFMWWVDKKHPSKGGFVHVPKHPHPGKPSPHIFKHK